MALFGKKRPEMKIEEAKKLALDMANQEIGKQRDSRVCYNHLEAQFLLHYSGVVLKLYIENFKRMNDLFGHEYCEELLDAILDYLEQKSGCPVYRYVGVEFIIVMRGKSMGEAVRLSEQLIERFDGSWDISGTDCMCTVQIGICAYPGYAKNAGELLKCLDYAITAASELGSNQYAAYNGEMNEGFMRRQAIARYLNTALSRDEVEVRYRPTYNLKLGQFTRAEFYMRIFVQDVGMVGSEEFISIAEDTGQIRQIEYYALDRAAAMAAWLTEQGKDFESIAVPVSAALLLQGDFLQEVSQVIDKYNLPAGKLAIEVDEYAAGEAYANMASRLQALSWLGVELILNNFGSGSSALCKILELPVDTLKFNRMFVWEIENNPKSAPVMEGLVYIARKMNKKLIAEGVETQKQKWFLENCGCIMQQGFYYAPTIPEKNLPRVLATSLEGSRSLVEQEKKALKKR